jgi:hypothetical protein
MSQAAVLDILIEAMSSLVRVLYLTAACRPHGPYFYNHNNVIETPSRNLHPPFGLDDLFYFLFELYGRCCMAGLKHHGNSSTPTSHIKLYGVIVVRYTGGEKDALSPM